MDKRSSRSAKQDTSDRMSWGGRKIGYPGEVPMVFNEADKSKNVFVRKPPQKKGM